MFEYMSAGLPVIASNFPLWKEIVEGNKCGICVDPMDPKAIASAIQWMIDHPEEAEEMGKNGRRAVETKYNWANESKKLVGLYQRLIQAQ
jgi:glycosyltransferase involved in cell wall biosynthesis